MPKIAMTESFEPLAQEVLADFEQAQGITFPDDYRRFLLEHNGGRPEESDFRFYNSKKGSTIHTLWGLNGDEYADLRKKLPVFKDRIPKRFFPVGRDEGGNLVCISLSGADRGKVYFWDHEEESDESQGETPDTRDNVVLIANSFQEFLDELHTEP